MLLCVLKRVISALDLAIPTIEQEQMQSSSSAMHQLRTGPWGCVTYLESRLGLLTISYDRRLQTGVGAAGVADESNWDSIVNFNIVSSSKLVLLSVIKRSS